MSNSCVIFFDSSGMVHHNVHHTAKPSSRNIKRSFSFMMLWDQTYEKQAVCNFIMITDSFFIYMIQCFLAKHNILLLCQALCFSQHGCVKFLTFYPDENTPERGKLQAWEDILQNATDQLCAISKDTFHCSFRQ